MRWFERNRAAMGPPGLFAEEYDVVQRQPLSNMLLKPSSTPCCSKAPTAWGQAGVASMGFQARAR